LQPILDLLAEMIAYDRDLKINMTQPDDPAAALESMFGGPILPPTVGLD